MDFIKNEEGFLSKDTEEVKNAIKKAFLSCHSAMAERRGKYSKNLIP
jgi:hypothetical protein